MLIEILVAVFYGWRLLLMLLIVIVWLIVLLLLLLLLRLLRLLITRIMLRLAAYVGSGG